MFRIKSYTKLDLARLYWPDTPLDSSACSLFRRDIRRCKGLQERLEQFPNYNLYDKHYPAAQVAVIIEYLGEP